MLAPWSKAEGAVARLESEGTFDALTEARAAIQGLKGLQAIPGVKTRLIELEGRFLAARARRFDEFVKAGDLENARALAEKFPVESAAVEELVRIAGLSLQSGEDPPPLGAIAPGDVKWELRPLLYEARYNQAVRSGNGSAIGEILMLWIQHDPETVGPHLLLTAHYLAADRPEAVVGHLSTLSGPLHEAVLAGLINDRAVTGHVRAFILIQLGRFGQAAHLLDEILEHAPKDEWAVSERLKIAEASGDHSVARKLSSILHEIHPDDVGLIRRLAELALSENDPADAIDKFRAAWRSGDVESGIACARLMHEGGHDISGFLGELAPRIETSDQAMALGEIHLGLDETRQAAEMFRRAFGGDRMKADAVIAKAHAYVQNAARPRFPLLELMCEVGPMRGYPADPYHLMMAEDLLKEGRGRVARPLLENLLETSLRWKAFSLLARAALDEAPSARSAMAARIEAVLADAKRSGRAIWAELKYDSALLSEMAGETAEAIAKYGDLLANEYDFRDAAARLERLEGIPKIQPLAKGPRYELLERIGGSSDAAVYRARDTLIDRVVAVKVLSGGDASKIDRAREAMRLNHPNIAMTFDAGREDGKWFTATEFLEGPTLKERLAAGPLRRDTVIEVMRALFSALSFAHARKIFHGNLVADKVIFSGKGISGAAIKLKDVGLDGGDEKSDMHALGVLLGDLARDDEKLKNLAQDLSAGNFQTMDGAFEVFKRILE